MRKSLVCLESGGRWGENGPVVELLLMLPTGPVWLALMWTSSGEVEVARVAGGGKRRCAFCDKEGMEMQLKWKMS